MRSRKTPNEPYIKVIIYNLGAVSGLAKVSDPVRRVMSNVFIEHRPELQQVSGHYR